MSGQYSFVTRRHKERHLSTKQTSLLSRRKQEALSELCSRLRNPRDPEWTTTHEAVIDADGFESPESEETALDTPGAQFTSVDLLDGGVQVTLTLSYTLTEPKWRFRKQFIWISTTLLMAVILLATCFYLYPPLLPPRPHPHPPHPHPPPSTSRHPHPTAI